MMVMIGAGSFVTLYLGLELLSLSLYAMVAMYRTSNAATEAAMKYFVLARWLRHPALRDVDDLRRHGIARHRRRREGARELAGRPDDPAVRARVPGLGVAFKLGAVPYHMWVPDVYDGAPTGVTLLIGTAPKLASFAVHAAAACRRARRALVRLAGHADGARGAVDDPRQHRRDRADQHEADARLFVDREHGATC
jgi:NADH-quinone oxidoreductase subunit N